MKQYFLGLLFLSILFVGCEKDDSNDDSTSNAIQVTTGDVSTTGDYKYNFLTSAEDSDTWHIVIQQKLVSFGESEYPMPSVSTGANVLIAIDTSTEFGAVTSTPGAGEFIYNSTDIEYGGTKEIIHYDMGTHQVSLSNDVYFFYEMVTHKIFKVQILEYSNWIVQFQFEPLN